MFCIALMKRRVKKIMNSFDRRFLQTLPFIKMSLMNDNMNNNDTL